MVQHDRRVREGARHRGRFAEVPERHPQIPGEPVFLEQCETAQPALVLHRARRAEFDAVGRRRGGRLRADAAHQRKSGLGGNHLFGVVGVEPGVRDDRAGEAVHCVDLADPAGLADLVGAVPFGLAMDGGQHIVGGGVAPVIRRQVVPLERPVIAHKERLLFGAAQPGVLVLP